MRRKCFIYFYAYKENCECEEIAGSLPPFYDFSDETNSCFGTHIFGIMKTTIIMLTALNTGPDIVYLI